MKKYPLISVIVPVYNVDQYLHRSIDSILSQTYTDIEILLVDDGSTDRSGKICDGYANKDPRVRVFHQELYNTAVSTQADIVLCSFYEYHGLGKTFLIEAISTESDKIEILRNYILSFTALWNMLVHRTLYDTYKLRIPKHITNCEDFWLTVRLFYYAKQISSLHIPLYYYNRENVNSILNNPNEERRNSEYLSYIDTINFFQSNGVLNLYEKEISWRILKCKQDLVLRPELHHRFLTMYPPSHHYILSCPTFFCNNRIKLLMWLLVHKMSFCVSLFCKIRTLIGRD